VVRPRLLLLTWIVATAAATGLAWLGVRSVVGDVADPLPAPELIVVSEPAAEPEPSDDPSEPAAPGTTTRTFTLTGGTATVQFSPTDVTVVSAVPVTGFETDVDRDDGRTRVEFESDAHQSRLDVWWDGAPRHSVREDAGDGHDDDDDDRDDDHDDD
jgi:hypothetical protein